MLKRTSDTDYLTECVTLAEAKAHLRVTHSDDDGYIENLINAASEYVEGLGNFWIGTAVTGEIYLNAFPGPNVDMECIAWIRVANTISIDAVQYIASGSTSYTDLSADYYEASVNSSPAHVLFKTKPALGKERDAVKISFTAGFASLPAKIKQAVLIAIGNMYETRQEEIVGTVLSKSMATTIDALIRNHKLYMPQ